MLQGSLENFALDEVLGLLSSTAKTGQLEVSGNRGSGSLSISEGRLVGGTVSSTVNGTALHDVVFELLRFSQGTFTFTQREVGPVETAEDVAAILADAEGRLRDWRQIEAVVPSLQHQVVPVADLPAEEVTISRAEWAALVVIAAGCPVSTVCDRLELGEVEGSRQIKDLAERGLVTVGEPRTGVASPPAAPQVSGVTTYEPLGSAGSTPETLVAPADTTAGPAPGLDGPGLGGPGLGSPGLGAPNPGWEPSGLGTEPNGLGTGPSGLGTEPNGLGTGPNGSPSAIGGPPVLGADPVHGLPPVAGDEPWGGATTDIAPAADPVDPGDPGLHAWPVTGPDGANGPNGASGVDTAATGFAGPDDNGQSVGADVLSGDGSIADPFAVDHTAEVPGTGSLPPLGSVLGDDARPPAPPMPDEAARIDGHAAGAVPPPPLLDETAGADANGSTEDGDPAAEGDDDSARQGGRGILARYLKSDD